MLHTCLILNGPPNCGKDTLADYLTEYGFTKHEFKAQLYKETANYYSVDLKRFTAAAKDRELKEMPYAGEFISPREMLIQTSEHYIKPNFGKDYFGKAAAQECVNKNSQLTVFSDGGFSDEMPPLYETFQSVIIVRLHRDGYDFGNDSRDYLKGFGHTYDVHILDGRVDLTARIILDIMDPYLPRLNVA